MFEEMMGTKPVSERQKFDVEALDAYLGAHVPGYPGGPLAVEQFKGGQSNPTFKISAGGQHYVLRTKPCPRRTPSTANSASWTPCKNRAFPPRASTHCAWTNR